MFDVLLWPLVLLAGPRAAWAKLRGTLAGGPGIARVRAMWSGSWGRGGEGGAPAVDFLAVVVVLLGALLLALWAVMLVAGGKDPEPPPVVIAKADSPEHLDSLIRAALLQGQSVRVECSPTGTPSAAPKTKDYWCRALTEADRPRVLRLLDRLSQSSRQGLADQSGDPLELETRIATCLRTIEMIDAAAILVKEGRCFLTKGPVLSPSARLRIGTTGRCPFHTKAELPLDVPIDLRRFPNVALRRQRSNESKQLVDTEAAYRWNSIPFAERRTLVDAATEARKRHGTLQAEMAGMRSPQSSLAPEAAQARLRELGAECSQLEAVVARVPRRYDPVTLESLDR